ncbi:condensation domain-containing protein [Segniliparus rotundus]|uniref:condensation domain-containing protein n=1 Tax=Segniliparus rotundus TaxID=286802 RepID=UPI001651237B|nr:condensation domain-containing protein [Segniliparus rotundus]
MVDRFSLVPGVWREWRPRHVTGALSRIGLAQSQRYHLSPLLGGAPSNPWKGWMALAFDVPGHVHHDALAAAFEALVRRHEALRCAYEVAGGEIQRRVIPPAHVVFEPPSAGVPFDGAEDMHRFLRGRLDEACDPTRSPSGLFAAVDRPEASTIICAFDHTAVDAMSFAVAFAELWDHYHARVEGREPAPLPPVGSFLEYCEFEAGMPAVPPEHPGFLAWREFAAMAGGVGPAFPLDLGVGPGALAPQGSAVCSLLSDAAAQSLERVCAAAGGSLFNGVVTALAAAVRELGGPKEFPLSTPLHTRWKPEWEQAVGWFVKNIPLILVAGDSFADGIARNKALFRSMLPAAKVPLAQVVGGEAPLVSLARRDVSAVSFLDYRKAPGAGLPAAARPRHISNVTVADDLQLWFSRTADGLSVRLRYPDTDIARRTAEGLVETMRDVVQAALRSSPLAPSR